MAEELELKAVVPDPDALRARFRAAGAEPGFSGMMRDRRFDRRAELVRRDEVLRVRSFEHPGGTVTAELTWKGPTRRAPGGYKRREELQLAVAGGSDPAELLARLGYEVVHAIDRHVDFYTLDGATLRIEEYPRMDVLLEVEGDPEAIERAVGASGIPRHEFTDDALTAFVERFERRTGVAAEVADGFDRRSAR
jgi:adenylate cyclase class IV